MIIRLTTALDKRKQTMQKVLISLQQSKNSTQRILPVLKRQQIRLIIGDWWVRSFNLNTGKESTLHPVDKTEKSRNYLWQLQINPCKQRATFKVQIQPLYYSNNKKTIQPVKRAQGTRYKANFSQQSSLTFQFITIMQFPNLCINLCNIDC